MICAVDVCYRISNAVAAGILFRNWDDSSAVKEFCVSVPSYEEYKSGQFYRRELPCLMKLFEYIDSLPQYIIIDGYVYLDNAKQPGLGKYLYDALNGESAVIGVAKRRYKYTPDETAIYRCGSKRGLYVTAVGVSAVDARNFIMQMHGEHRVPTLLRRVDRLSKETKDCF
jgi:deoxyribonuclease V